MHNPNACCLKAPVCLEPKQACIEPASRVSPHGQRPECSKYREFCGKAVYDLPSTRVKMTLPVMTEVELSELYTGPYNGEWYRGEPAEQAKVVLDAHANADSSDTGLTVVEMGCGSGLALYNLRHLAAKGGKLICFEPDASNHASLKETLTQAKENVKGLEFQLIPSFFSSGALLAKSVDIFTSSHTLQRFADPCPWLAEVSRVLKPGGLVFTEVPDQDVDPGLGVSRGGQFHLLYFNTTTLDQMMTNAGFQPVKSVTVSMPPGGDAVRGVYRKPKLLGMSALT